MCGALNQGEYWLVQVQFEVSRFFFFFWFKPLNIQFVSKQIDLLGGV